MAANAEKSSNRNIKFLFLTITVMFLLIFAFNTVLGLTDIRDQFRFVQAGDFSGIHRAIYDEGLEFSARLANGRYTFFVNLSREDLDNLFLSSNVDSGEISLSIIHGTAGVDIDLTGEGFNVPFHNIDMSTFSPGRIQFTLRFTHAENVAVNIGWRGITA